MSKFFLFVFVCFSSNCFAQKMKIEDLWGPNRTVVDLNRGESINYGQFLNGDPLFANSIICSDVKIDGDSKTFNLIRPGESLTIGEEDRIQVSFRCNANPVVKSYTVHFGCDVESRKESRNYSLRADVPESYSKELAAELACKQFGGVLNRAKPIFIPGKIVPRN